jgi:hypothetical protein
VLVTGLAMFFVATGYASLNRWRAHAGAPYVWLGEAISPSVGAGTGFLNVAVSTFANVGNITLAGAYLLFVLFPTHTFSKPVTWVVATAIMGVLVYFTVCHAVAGVGGFKGLAEAAVPCGFLYLGRCGGRRRKPVLRGRCLRRLAGVAVLAVLRGVREAAAVGPDGGHRRGRVRRQPAGGRSSGLNLGQLYFQPDGDHGAS